MSRELIADPDKEGLQLIARARDGRAVGFATVFWTWSTLSAARIGVMNDLFVSPDARGAGAAARPHRACTERCRERGVTRSTGRRRTTTCAPRSSTSGSAPGATSLAGLLARGLAGRTSPDS